MFLFKLSLIPENAVSSYQVLCLLSKCIFRIFIPGHPLGFIEGVPGDKSGWNKRRMDARKGWLGKSRRMIELGAEIVGIKGFHIKDKNLGNKMPP